jgi:hypothetical protein
MATNLMYSCAKDGFSVWYQHYCAEVENRIIDRNEALVKWGSLPLDVQDLWQTIASRIISSWESS